MTGPALVRRQRHDELDRPHEPIEAVGGQARDAVPAAGASAVYVGTVRHRRYAPRRHAFRFRLFMMYLDLDELPALFAGRWLWRYERPALAAFRRADYLGEPGVPLAEAVRTVVAERTGRRPAGPIRLLTHLRYFGYCFNPVSFYYCFDHTGARIEAIVAEITNTPWNERHAYVLSAAQNLGSADKLHYRFAKTFHVSPFLAMEQQYRWRFVTPGERLLVHMENHAPSGRVFDATLSLRRRSLSTAALAGTLLAHPFMTARISAAIYLHAARLWLKRVPVHAHPASHDAAR